ncbi:MAG: L-serine ammonia-lyase, iron-sulfur-dependent, subunit alpha [Oscillospiraceae bacterium]
MSYTFTNGKDLLKLCHTENITIGEVMLRREIELFGITRNAALQKMNQSFEIMRNAVHDALFVKVKTMGGLIGGEASKVNGLRLDERNICGSVISKAVAYSMGVLEINASMGLIVAAPTAGSSGVIPGVFFALQEELGFSDDEIIMALFSAGAIGYIISRNATVAGAEGGCQAEIGSASAMAAAAATELIGGSPEQALSAAADAISNILGLVCDPIGGLVEAPCQKRNAMGASNAIICAEIALSGVMGIIPFDEIVDAMYRVGKSLPYELRETALGGIAATPTACSLCSGCR